MFGHRVDRATGLGALLAGDERADEHDPLALLARDPRPVVGVGGVGQVLVLLELVDAGLQQVRDPQSVLVLLEEVLCASEINRSAVEAADKFAAFVASCLLWSMHAPVPERVRDQTQRDWREERRTQASVTAGEVRSIVSFLAVWI